MISFLFCCFKEKQIVHSEQILNNGGATNNVSSLRTLVQISGSVPDESWTKSYCNYQQCCDFRDCCNCSGFCYHYNLGENSAIQFNSNVGPLYEYYESQSCSVCYSRYYKGSSLFGSMFPCFFNNQLIIDKQSTPLSNASFDQNFGNGFSIANEPNQNEFQMTDVKHSSNKQTDVFFMPVSPRSQISHNPSRSTTDTTTRDPRIIPVIRAKKLQFD